MHWCFICGALMLKLCWQCFIYFVHAAFVIKKGHNKVTCPERNIEDADEVASDEDEGVDEDEVDDEHEVDEEDESEEE